MDFPDTLVTLGGDLISPSVESTVFKGQQMVDLMNQFGLTASVIGNHGAYFFLHFLGGIIGPHFSAN